MSQQAFLKNLVGLLDVAGIPYMAAGSLGSTYYGEPRSTNDVDFVVAPDQQQLEAFLEGLNKDYYVSAQAAREALQRRSLFNVIDFQTGWKADLIVCKDRPFSQMEFTRRRREVILDIPLWIASPEDIILAKLEWARITPSDRQLRDVLGIAVLLRASLDQEYLRHWAKELGVSAALERTLEVAKELQSPPEG